jgi:hypothetical protein
VEIRADEIALDTLWSGGPFNATDDNPYNGGNPTSSNDPQLLKDVRASIFERGNASESISRSRLPQVSLLYKRVPRTTGHL